MKKLSAFLLSGLLILPLAACGRSPTAIPPSNDKPQSEHQANVYEVGDIVLGDGTLIKPEELTAIYENRQAVNASLRTIHGLDSNAAVEGLGTNWYWASTPSDTEDGYAWFVHYFNGYAACCPTDFDNLHVMVVQNFAGVEQ